MKKIFFFLQALMLLVSCSSNREQTLKVYNWSNYIDESLIPEFEQWYKLQTGEDVKVIYQTFDINETMLAKIEKGKEDYDVVCPSDYIIERMLNEGLLQPLDFASLPDSINYIVNCRSPYIRDVFSKINRDIDANDYSVAYMWGTTGLLYNSKYVTDEEASTWDLIRNPKFRDKIFIKDAPRDVFSPVLIRLRYNDILEGKITRDSLMYDSSDSSITAVENYLKDVSELVAGWEADFGKEQMTQEKGYVSLNWSGDAVWAIREAEEVGVELKYSVPKEGSNVWFDGWVIPKYARNTKAATFFIDFMCRPDIAIRNMEETGYVSANGDISVLGSQIDTTLAPVDLSYFFGAGADSVCIDPVLYPDKSTIETCSMMHDWGDRSDKLIAMWSRVKGSEANTTTIVVVAATLIMIVAFMVWKNISGTKRSRKKGRRA
ncbi:MAG: ABC transporter substrate-binding protein [Bacteroidales bacterium]|nr:ABC transporter substrate-binding protein [Bacteroidales bacterium]